MKEEELGNLLTMNRYTGLYAPLACAPKQLFRKELAPLCEKKTKADVPPFVLLSGSRSRDC